MQDYLTYTYSPTMRTPVAQQKVARALIESQRGMANGFGGENMILQRAGVGTRRAMQRGRSQLRYGWSGLGDSHGGMFESVSTTTLLVLGVGLAAALWVFSR